VREKKGHQSPSPIGSKFKVPSFEIFERGKGVLITIANNKLALSFQLRDN
jgi:hypothetical protein